MKAFEVICNAFNPPLCSITWAEKASAAKYVNWKSANEVGYKVKFGDFRVKRSPKHDNHPDAKPNLCRGIETLSF